MAIEKLLHLIPMTRVLICFIFFISNLFASDNERFASLIDNMKTLSGDFEQVVTDINGDLVQEVKGHFYFKKPNMFRWNYEEPYKNQIISDGELIYMYDPDLKQVILSALKKLGGVSPAMLLVSSKAKEFFLIDTLKKDEKEWFRAVPKKVNESSFKQILISFNNNQLSEMQIQDNFDYVTNISFIELKENKTINDAFFLFNTPEGVDVIKN